MAPETLVLNNNDKIINKIRTVFDAVTFTGGPEEDLTPEQEADNAISALSAHAGAVTRIAEKIAAAMFSVAASDRALIESAVQFKGKIRHYRFHWIPTVIPTKRRSLFVKNTGKHRSSSGGCCTSRSCP